MTPIEALGIAVLISLVLSTALCLVIVRPLQALLIKACPGPEAVQFWGRFTLIMLFLSPLFISIAFGLPPSSAAPQLDGGTIVQRIISAGLVGAFLAMLGLGFWVSTMMRRAPTSPMTVPTAHKEKWEQ